jgi:hypothetical protein
MFILMSGTLVTEISVSNVKKINHGLPLRQNNMNGVNKQMFYTLKMVKNYSTAF